MSHFILKGKIVIVCRREITVVMIKCRLPQENTMKTIFFSIIILKVLLKSRTLVCMFNHTNDTHLKHER